MIGTSNGRRPVGRPRKGDEPQAPAKVRPAAGATQDTAAAAAVQTHVARAAHAMRAARSQRKARRPKDRTPTAGTPPG
jgi:hypothetical protein